VDTSIPLDTEMFRPVLAFLVAPLAAPILVAAQAYMPGVTEGYWYRWWIEDSAVMAYARNGRPIRTGRAKGPGAALSCPNRRRPLPKVEAAWVTPRRATMNNP